MARRPNNDNLHNHASKVPDGAAFRHRSVLRAWNRSAEDRMLPVQEAKISPLREVAVDPKEHVLHANNPTVYQRRQRKK